MSPRSKTRLFGVVVMCLATLATPAVAAASQVSSGATASRAGTCAQTQIPVGLAAGTPNTLSISGTLCQPTKWAAGPHSVDVLVHGYTYNRSYWDWPQDPSLYSFVDKDLAAGRATLAIDRIGDGASSHPLSTLITPTSDAYQLHQVISAMKARFAGVNLVAHSLGSYIAALETSTYNDADRLIITGLLHGEGPSFALLEESLYPASLDPQFAGSGLDPNYYTTLPGLRGPLFYYGADPSVVAYDEAHKDVGPNSQLVLAALQHFILPPALNETFKINRPVLLIDGTNDNVFCGLTLACNDPASVTAHEAPYYPDAASLTTVLVPGTGHDLALHPTAPQSFADIDQWIRTH